MEKKLLEKNHRQYKLLLEKQTENQPTKIRTKTKSPKLINLFLINFLKN